jgi:phenylpropionate dioxygenase-like ring-hydroxylating dioxygenase large terminal subunit
MMSHTKETTEPVQIFADDREWHNTPGPSYQALLDIDRYEVPQHLRDRSPWPDDLNREIPRDRYLRQDIHDAEVERMWMHCWQMVCRTDHLVEVGDSVVYRIADRSFIVVRSDEQTIKAFPNTCLHRGRVLRECDGPIARLRCPYHAFTWALDGSFVEAPAFWDFDATPEELQLPEAKVGVWAGMVFINPDPDAESLEDFLGDIDQHFDRIGYGQWSTQGHIVTTRKSNWKEAVEAFVEAHHVFATHPQAMLGTDPGNSQYDIWESYARIIMPMGKPSTTLSEPPTEQRTLNGMMGVIKARDILKLPDGVTARHHFADLQRNRLRAAGIGVDIDLCDSEMTDLLTYFIFPNLLILGGARGMVLRFRPDSGPHSCIVDIYQLSPKAPGPDTPRPAEPKRLDESETFTSDAGIPQYGLLDQDLSNFDTTHDGVANLPDRPLILAKYQECVIAYFHHLIYDRWLGEA